MSTRTAAYLAVCLLGLPALAGCRQNMHNQHKIEPLEASPFFADGQGARELPEGVVPRNAAGAKVASYTGLTLVPAPEVENAPPPVTLTLIRRGQQRYDIFCAPCHSRVGDGRGMIVRRGYKQPPSLHDPRMKGAPADYFVTVMTQGFGVMPSYAEEVAPEDRWAIAAYIRALQLQYDMKQNEQAAAARPEVR